MVWPVLVWSVFLDRHLSPSNAACKISWQPMMQVKMSTRMIAISMVMAVIIAACGSGDDEGQATVPDDPSSPASVTTTQADAAAAPSSGLICEDPPPTAMDFGVAVAGENGADAYTVCYQVEVSGDIGTLIIELTGLSDDLNVGVGYGDIETVQYNTGEYWSSSEFETGDESVVIDDPAAGTYFIKIGPGTSKNISAYTLTVAGS
jgi:hypothetical protein